ncbi:MAG: hypothetical protein ABSH35_27875 [Isosphaeraceae bacterium]
MPRRNRDRKRRNRETRRQLGEGQAAVVVGARAARNFALSVEKGLDHFTAMLAITTGKSPTANDVVANATGTLINTGKNQFLVTNHHVYAEFQSHRDKNPHSKLIMSGAHGMRFLDISEAKCLGADKAFDLAVLSVPPLTVFNQRKLFLCPEKWPPPRAEKGMLAVLVGYPGEGRNVEQSGALGASPLSAVMRVVSVSERHFVIADEDQDAHVFVPKGQKPLTSFGGISGSGVYVICPKGVTSDDVWLAGFVYEEGPGHSLMVAHADHINADGTIR